VRFPFSRPDAVSAASRPLVDVWIDDVDMPLRCVVDTGSLRTRLPPWPARALGLDLAQSPSETIGVGGMRVVARQTHVVLRIEGLPAVPSSVWFCDDWLAPYGLLGQEDVLRGLRLTHSAAGEWFRLEPEDGVLAS
jgi:Aspartyl protease